MIYEMNGMVTELNLRADAIGHFQGLATHFSGDGFADMHFDVEALTAEAFDAWAADARAAGASLTRADYTRLAEQSHDVEPYVYGSVEPGLFEAVVRREVPPGPGPKLSPSGRENRP
jgi:cytochrome o ubiquinol oxidase subunit 2